MINPARQDPALSSRPDLVAIPVGKFTWRPIYNKAIAIEVESCNEVMKYRYTLSKQHTTG